MRHLSKTYCNACGAHNAVGIQKCITCGCPSEAPVKTNPITSASLSNPKLALFDIDDTLLDPKERFRSAVRAGIVDKEGMPIKEGFNTGWKKRDAFLYRDDMLAKDKVIPNSIELIDHLMKKGYTIAYCTSRSFSHYEATKAQLESKGFPLFNTPNGDTLLFLKKSRGENAAKYKAGVIQSLQSQYEVMLFFDDKLEIQQAAASVGVPGVYQSVNAYWGLIARTNPGRKDWEAQMGKEGQYVPVADPEKGYRGMIDPDDDQGRTVGETSYMPEGEGGEATLDDFRKNGRWGAGGTGGPTVDSIGYMPPLDDKTGGVRMVECPICEKDEFEDELDDAGHCRMCAKKAKSNPANPSKVSKGKKLYKHMNGKEPAKVEKKTIDVGDVWYQVGEGGCWQIGYRSGKETGSSDQKYTHHFNEETKDGNFPKLYATIPDNGKPMLIITGGTWKIKTDENNVAWIYD